MLPWYLTSAMLHSYILCNCLQIIKLPLDISIYQHSNDRPNIHLCMHPMKHPIQTSHDLAFLVPLNPIIEWIRVNIFQFLMYCNSQSDTEKIALFLQS